MKKTSRNRLLTALTAAAFAGAAALPLALSAPAQADHHAKKATGQPTPDEALAKLMEGNARFVEGKNTHPNMSLERRAELAEGQAPYAIIVSCSDSRVAPELLFDAGPGDLFIIRAAGNIVDDYGIGSVEYAAGPLASPLVVVLGHESCGAVDAAVAAEVNNADFPGRIHDIVEDIRPAVEAAMEHATGPALLEEAISVNAVSVAKQLSRSEPILEDAVEAGTLKIVAARYDLDTGKVELIEDTHDH